MVHHDDDAPGTGPVRTCIGCRRRAARRELLRVVVGTDANGRPAVVADPRGVAPGRGAHLHPTRACLDAAIRRKAFTRALRAGAGLAGGPLAEHLQHLEQHLEQDLADSPAAGPARTDTNRNWSSSS